MAIFEESIVTLHLSEYKRLVWDSTFAKAIAGILADELRKPFYTVSDATKAILRVYDPDLYEKAEAERKNVMPRSYPQTEYKPISELLNTYKDEHGEEGENE